MIIKQVEASRIRTLSTPGKQLIKENMNGGLEVCHGDRFWGGTAVQHSSIVDENYMVIGTNLDLTIRNKIVKGEYVDFARLQPRDRVSTDEPRLELVNRGGQTFFVPAEHDSNPISSFYKWEQAFRVFSNIYTSAHPNKAAELIQYNHVIFTA